MWRVYQRGKIRFPSLFVQIIIIMKTKWRSPVSPKYIIRWWFYELFWLQFSWFISLKFCSNFELNCMYGKLSMSLTEKLRLLTHWGIIKWITSFQTESVKPNLGHCEIGNAWTHAATKVFHFSAQPLHQAYYTGLQIYHWRKRRKWGDMVVPTPSSSR